MRRNCMLIVLFVMAALAIRSPMTAAAEDSPWVYQRPCWVYIPEGATKTIAKDEVLRRLAAAVLHVESVLGPFDGVFHVYLKEEVLDREGVRRPGLARWENRSRWITEQYAQPRWGGYVMTNRQRQIVERTVYCEIEVKHCTESILRHEAAHCWLSLRGIYPEGWVNEGIAHYVQFDDGMDHRSIAMLRDRPLVSPNDLKTLPTHTERDAELRAAAWATVYHLRVVGWSFEKIAAVRTPFKLERCVATVLAADDRAKAAKKTAEESAPEESDVLSSAARSP